MSHFAAHHSTRTLVAFHGCRHQVWMPEEAEHLAMTELKAVDRAFWHHQARGVAESGEIGGAACPRCVTPANRRGVHRPFVVLETVVR